MMSDCTGILRNGNKGTEVYKLYPRSPQWATVIFTLKPRTKPYFFHLYIFAIIYAKYGE